MMYGVRRISLEDERWLKEHGEFEPKDAFKRWRYHDDEDDEVIEEEELEE